MTDVKKGLTADEVEQLTNDGMVNVSVGKQSKTIGQIVAGNVFTYFNLIFAVFAVLLALVRSYNNMTFLPVIISNMFIGIIQEIRAKKVLDKLTVVNAPKTSVIREGQLHTIASETLVKGDLCVFSAGNQLSADAILVDGFVRVNESLVTGESDEVVKNAGDILLSGSFIVSGECRAVLTNVGLDAYAAKLAIEAKAGRKKHKTDMMQSLDKLVKTIGVLIIPIGAGLFLQSRFAVGGSIKSSIDSMVASLVGMIPEGLYLLASVALVVSVMRLGKKNVIVHEMNCVETLARVNVLCVDKTGTITNNTMKVLDIFDKNGNSLIDKKEDLKILAKYINTIEDKNITIDAIKEQLYGISTEKLSNIEKENFNSKNKFSFIKIDENVTYKLGAPEILLNKEYEELVNKRTKNGERLIAFVEVKNDETIPILFISLKNEIRKNAKEIFGFFDNRNVQIRVISGDNPITVSSIAKQAGIKGYEKYIDCRELKNYADIQKAVKKYIVFGRVNPEQKRQIIKALKEQGLKVAMTGDGVNDILAMKEADCSIAIGSGSDAARGTAQVVLLDSDFGKMRNIVYEGRKNINNITRSASLFTYKNIFSLLLSIYSIIFAIQYPLEPNQVSLGSAFTIGIPAFLLTFEENQKKQQNGNFMRKVFTNSLPAAITSFLAIVAMVKFSDLFNVGVKEITTACSYLFFTGGFLILYKIIRPLNKYRTSVMFLCILGIILTINIMPNFFAIKEISERSAILVTLFAIAEFSVIRWVTLILDKYEKNRKSNA